MIIKSLKMKNSYGCDEIPITILKLSFPFIISPITFILTIPFLRCIMKKD